MPNGAKIAHGDGKKDNEGRKRNQTQNANIKTSANPNVQMEVAEVDEWEDKVVDHNDDNKSNNDNTQGGKLRGKNV